MEQTGPRSSSRPPLEECSILPAGELGQALPSASWGLVVERKGRRAGEARPGWRKAPRAAGTAVISWRRRGGGVGGA